MFKRLSLAEKRRITRAVYIKHGYHIEHWYPFTAVPIRPAQIRVGAAEVGQARRAAEAAIAEAERINGGDRKRRHRE